MFKSRPVEVRRDDYGNVWYSGLYRCGKVWLCPICNDIKAKQDRRVIKRAVENWGGCVLQVTFDLWHDVTTSLSTSLEATKKAYRSLHAGGAFQKIKSEYGIRGSLPSLEINWGQKGWHPNIHALVFFHQDTIPTAKFEADLLTIWRKTVGKVGGYANEYGLDVKSKFNPGYLAKGVTFSADDASRTNDEDHLVTVWDLLADYANGDLDSGRRFSDYAQATKNRRPLRWSKGFKPQEP